MYLMSKALQIRCPFRKLWFIKVPLKIKIFLWLMFKNSILTKDKLTKRGWVGDEKCRFCEAKESVDHFFIHRSLAKYVWGAVSCALGYP